MRAWLVACAALALAHAAAPVAPSPVHTPRLDPARLDHIKTQILSKLGLSTRPMPQGAPPRDVVRQILLRAADPHPAPAHRHHDDSMREVIAIAHRGITGSDIRQRIERWGHKIEIPVTTLQPNQYCGNNNMTNSVMLRNNYSYATIFKVVFIMLVVITPLIWNVLKKQRNTVKTIAKSRKTNNMKTFVKLNHFRAILNALDVGVISTNSQMKITYMNSMAGKMCDWCPKQAIGMPINTIVQCDKEPEPNVSEVIPRSLFGETALVLRSQKGKFIYVQIMISPLNLQGHRLTLRGHRLTLRGHRLGAVTLLIDVTASREVIRKLSYSASHDSLTGLPNRATFERCLQNAAITSQRKEHALVYIDLDGFKKINDNDGHAAGDELLKQIALLMKSQLRHTDLIARLGGDEFGILLYDCGLSKAKGLMDRLVHLIVSHSFVCEGKVKYIGASVGITKVVEAEVGRLMANADTACYEAKRRGKGQVCLYQDLNKAISSSSSFQPAAVHCWT